MTCETEAKHRREEERVAEWRMLTLNKYGYLRFQDAPYLNSEDKYVILWSSAQIS